MRSPLCAASIIALAAASFAPTAMAQQADPAASPTNENTTQIDDIVVTAQKRSENVQDVPIAISAFTSEALQERAIGSVNQLSNITPNVTLDAGTPFSGSTAVLSAFIRGIGSDDFAFNIDPGVGIYIDSVYLARTVGANQDLLDVERIEILKGPQGTLFGRNTIGGAISVVTRDPGDTFNYRGDVTTGSYRLLQARGSVDLPLTENLSSSITYGLKTRQGYLERVPYPDQRVVNTPSYTNFASSDFNTNSREGGSNSLTLRGKLRWNAGGAFRATLAGDYGYEDSSGIANKLLATAPNVPGNFAGTSNLPGTAFDPTGATGFLFAGLYNFCIGATPGQIAARNAQALCGATGTQFEPGLRLPGFGSVNVDGNPLNDRLPFDNRFLIEDKDKSYATGNNFSKLENWGVAATVEADLSESATLKSITSYRRTEWTSGQDADGSPLNFLQLSFDQRQEQFSQELQLLGNAFDQNLKYVLGGYYFHEEGTLHDFVTFAEGLLQVDGPNTFDTENYAFFGQVDYRISDLIGVTIGGRYTSEEKAFEGGQQDLNGFNYKLFGCSDANGNITPGGPFPLAPIPCQVGLGYPNPANPIQVYAPGVNTKQFENFSPKLGIQIHPTDAIMVYGSWSKGYKTGGWTTRLTNPLPTAQDFDEEEATTWEIGVKSQLFDRRVQINAAAFSTDYDGIQLNFQQGTSPTIRNAGDARIRGIELETVVVPMSGLTLNTSVGYLDAEYTLVLPGVLAVSGPNVFQAGTSVGAELPKTPEWKINFSPRYETNLANGGSLIFLADWTHTSSMWNDAQRSFILQRPATDNVNASVTYQEPNGYWTATVGGTNLTDERYLTTGGPNIAAGTFFGTYSRPAEWYVRLGIQF